MSKLEKTAKIKEAINDSFEHEDLIELVDEKVVTYSADGKTISFSLAENEFVDYVLMGDEYFYNNWLTQFAIGTVAGRNYFDMSTWSEITDRFTKGVIVVHEETKAFLFIIPKFIEPNYSAEAQALICRLSRMAGRSKNQSREEATKTVSAFAKLFQEISSKEKEHGGVTDLIPNRIYEMFKVNPKVLKDVIYIRDHFKTIGANDKNGDEATRIITKRYNNEPITKKEKEFIWSLTEGQYIFADGGISEDNATQPSKPKKTVAFNPFAD